MPSSPTLGSKRITIGMFKHRVALASMHDIVEENGTMILARSDVYHGWAYIEPKRASTFSKQGYGVMESGDVQTHIIIMRFRPDIDVSSAAWLYEERLQSGNRWFKIIAVTDDAEDGTYFKFFCRLIERGESLVAPVAQEDLVAMRPTPDKVRL